MRVPKVATVRSETIQNEAGARGVGTSRNLRVLHVGKFYPPHMGGMETHLRTLCAGLKNSVDLKVIVANDTRWTEQSAVEGVDVTRLGTLLSLSSTPICPLIAQKI